MAMSFYSNWETVEQLCPDTNNYTFHPQAEPELTMELLGFQDRFFLPETSIDPLFEPLKHNNYSSSHLLPNCLSPPFDNYNYNSNSLSTSDHFLLPECTDPYQQYPNHNYQNSYEEDHYYYYSNLSAAGLSNDFVPNPPLLPEFMPELHLPLPDFPTPPVYSSGSVVEAAAGKRSSSNGGSFSAQSIAARQRRRKITDKTQQLGKLIPGGHKMNTAEMFQAAFKYIKFLQAQVGVLESMTSIQVHDENEERQIRESEELQVLVASPRIQEKLSSLEKCMVPKQLVQILANDSVFQSSSLMSSKELDQFITSTSG